MKRFFLGCLFAIFILPGFSQVTNRIGGRVVINTRARKGISHVEVTLPGLGSKTKTGSDGYFSIEGIKQGLSLNQKIHITFRKEKYIAIDTTLYVTTKGELQNDIVLSRDFGIYGYLYFQQIENGEKFLIENAKITTTGDEKIYASKENGSFWIPLNQETKFDSITLIIRHKDFNNKIIRYSIKDATSGDKLISLKKKQ